MTEKQIAYPTERPNVWRSAATDPPAPDTWIILLDDSDKVFKGYMRKVVFEGHDTPTHSFHGEYYDFKRSAEGSLRGYYVYCLVNAVAWMPMPKSPEKWEQAEKDGKANG